MISRKETQNLKMQYGIWLGLSKEARQSAGLPVDQDKFAEHIGVTPKTLSGWKKDPIVTASRDNALQLFVKHADFAVYDALIKSATDTSSPKSAQDRRTYFQVTGALSKQTDKSTGEKHQVEIIIKDEFSNRDSTLLPSASGLSEE